MILATVNQWWLAGNEECGTYILYGDQQESRRISVFAGASQLNFTFDCYVVGHVEFTLKDHS